MIDRYTRQEMGEVWQLQNRFQKMLEVEVAVAKAQALLGIIPASAAREIEKKGKFQIEKIQEIEKKDPARCHCLRLECGRERRQRRAVCSFRSDQFGRFGFGHESANSRCRYCTCEKFKSLRPKIARFVASAR